MKKLFCTVLLFVFAVTNLAVSAADASMYTTNLFGESYYNCDTTEIGSMIYTTSVDNEVFHEGTASVKFTGVGNVMFKKRIDGDLRGKTAEVSFWLKKDSNVTFSSNDINLYYKIYYNDGTGENVTPATGLGEIVNVGTSQGNDWQEFKKAFTVANPDLSGNVTGVEFSMIPNGGNPTMLTNGALWLDQISLKLTPASSELLTTVTSVSAIPDSGNDTLTSGVKLTLDTDLVTDESLSGMTVSLNGQNFTNFTIDINDAGSNAEVLILFDTSVTLSKFSAGNLKDVWGRNISGSTLISVESIMTFTENLFGDALTACENVSAFTSEFNKSVDSENKWDGTGSIKWTADANDSGAELISATIPVTAAEAPEKIRVSMHIKLGEGTTVHGPSGDATYDKDFPVDKFRFYYNLIYTDANGETKTIGNGQSSLIPDGQFVNCDKDSTDWQYISYTYTPSYNAIPEGGTLTGVKINVRPYLGITCRITNGSINVDKIYATRVPEDGKYVPEFLGTEPTDGENEAPTDKVVFKFRGAVEAGFISADEVLINGKSKPVVISDSYSENENITRVTVKPISGFENVTSYNVKITDIRDFWGRALEGAFDTDFTTISKYTVTTSFVTCNDSGTETGIITAAQSGNIKAKFNVRNNTASAKTAVLVIAACNGDNIEKFAVSGETTIQAGETETITATVNGFTAGEGKYLRAFLWDTVNTHRPMAEITELR